MKATGIVRNVDSYGRFVFPAELRERLGVKENGGAFEVFVDEDSIILKKYEPACTFCGSSDEIALYEDRNICKTCAKKISKLKFKKW